MTPESLAIVRIASQDQVRPAAFVFPRVGGFAWVEPSYRAPEPVTQPAVHILLGEVHDQDDGFDVLRGGSVVATVRPWSTAQDDADGSCGRALADFTDLLVADGVSLQSERVVVETLLAAATAMAAE